jgi:hypothetical protein
MTSSLKRKFIPKMMKGIQKWVFEREMCPWEISISILVIRCPTHTN